jgi:hypothetical protein
LVSYEGNCPHRNSGEDTAGQVFNFTVPKDIASGEAVFAWAWFNREQEFNMNCAAILIAGGEVGSNVSTNSRETASTDSEAVATDGFATTPASKDTKTATTQPSSTIVAFNERPEMFVADVGDECLTPKTNAELKYPQPGVDVVKGDGAYPLQLPSGNCSRPT